jgi:signal transduction histidine kinase
MTRWIGGRTRAALGIRTRMLLLVGTGAVLTLSIVGWIAVSSIGGLMQQVLAGRRSLAQSTALETEHALRAVVEGLSTIEAAPGFSLADADMGPETLALHSVRLRTRVLASVALIGLDGTVLAHEPRRAAADAAAAARLPEAGLAATTGRPTVAALADDSRQVRAHVFFVPVGDGMGRVAAVAAGIRAIDDQGWTRLLRVGPPGRTLTVDLVDGAGTIAASSVAARVGRQSERTELLRLLQQRHEVVVEDLAPDGGPEEVLAYAPFALVPWGVVVRQSNREVFAAVYQARSRLLTWGPVMLALGLLFTWGAAQSVRQPLAVLTRAAERIASGDLRERVPPLPDDEIGRLGQSFETMRARLAASMDDITRTNQDLERRVAERTRQLEAAHRELTARDELRGRLLRKVITAQEEERKRLARELHDETCQKLAALGIRLETALGAESPEVLRERLTDARTLSGQTLDDIHRIIFDLRPSVLDDLGLLAAIHWYAGRQLEARGITTRVDVSDGELRLPSETETALFRAVQEAINNIARHSRAENALIEITRDAAGLQIEIEDDGAGFDVAEVATPTESGRGLGLTGLRERMELLGGTAHVDSSPGDGTRVTLRVPVG